MLFKLYTFYHVIGILLEVHSLCIFAGSKVVSLDQLYVKTSAIVFGVEEMSVVPPSRRRGLKNDNAIHL